MRSTRRLGLGLASLALGIGGPALLGSDPAGAAPQMTRFPFESGACPGSPESGLFLDAPWNDDCDGRKPPLAVVANALRR
jgi:hypothetical protein